jgi:hypothetical protein
LEEPPDLVAVPELVLMLPEDDGVVMSSVLLLQAPRANKAESATAVAKAGLSLDANI